MKSHYALMAIFPFLIGCSLFGDDEDEDDLLSSVTVHLEEDCFPGEVISIYNVGVVTESDGSRTSVYDFIGQLNGPETNVSCGETQGLSIPFHEDQKCEMCQLVIVPILENFTYGSFFYNALNDPCVNALSCNDFYWNEPFFNASPSVQLIEINEVDLRSTEITVISNNSDFPIDFEFGYYEDIALSLTVEGSLTIDGENKDLISHLYWGGPVFYFTLRYRNDGRPLPSDLEAKITLGSQELIFTGEELLVDESFEFNKIYYFWRS